MRLDLYLLRSILGGIVMTLVVLVGLAVILLFLDELDKVEGAYTTSKAMLFVLYMLPGYLLEFFPLATLVGSVMALGQLAAGHEITAMRAAGVSLLRLARPVVLAGLGLGLLGILLGETLAPIGQTQARLMRAEALGHTLSLQGEQGLWLRERERFVHIGYVTPAGALHQVRVFSFHEDQALREALRLEQVILYEHGWEAHQLQGVTFEAQAVHLQSVARETLAPLVPTNLLNVLVVLPQYMSMQELWRYAHFLDANRLESQSYWLAWWGKLFAPLQVMAMLLLALPFALITRRSGGAGQRMVLGIVLGLAVLILTRLLTQGGMLLGLPTWLAASLPPALFLALAILGLRRSMG